MIAELTLPTLPRLADSVTLPEVANPAAEAEVRDPGCDPDCECVTVVTTPTGAFCPVVCEWPTLLLLETMAPPEVCDVVVEVPPADPWPAEPELPEAEDPEL